MYNDDTYFGLLYELHRRISLSFYESNLTFKVPVMTEADDIHKYFFMFFRENKT